MMTNDQIAEAVDAALKYALELSEEDDGWKVEKEQGEAVVKTKKNKDGRKVWLCTATVNVGPKLLFDKMKVIETVVTRILFSCSLFLLFSSKRCCYINSFSLSYTPCIVVFTVKDVDNLTSWNTTLTQSKTLKAVSDDTKVTYQVTTEGGAGVVSARDFVYGSKILVTGNKMVIGGLSVIVEEQPEVKGIVRAVHGPGCQVVIDTGDTDK